MLDTVIELIRWKMILHSIFGWSVVLFFWSFVGCWLFQGAPWPLPFMLFVSIGFLSLAAIAVSLSLSFLLWMEVWPFIPM